MPSNYDKFYFLSFKYFLNLFMNKKKCPQCKNLISISAPTCLYCGRPNKFVTKDYIKKKWIEENNKKTNYTLRNFILLLVFLFIIAIFKSK